MANPEPYLTVRAARPIVSGLRNLGYDPGLILSAIGMDERILEDPDAHIPMSLGVALLARGVEMTGDQDLGLHLALSVFQRIG